jgi:transcriptional regulator with XRE-family HTH domain
MVLEKTIGRNIKAFRESQALTQDQLAEFLGIKRPMISYYENGEREIPMTHLDKLANLFGTEIGTLMEENPENIKSDLAFAFRAEGLNISDMQEIACFKKVVKNFLKMKQLENENY